MEPTIRSACSPRTASAWSAFLIPFLPFVYGYPSSSPCIHCTLNKSVPTGRNCFAQRPQKRERLLGTTRRMGDERVKAQSQVPTRKTEMPWTAARTTKCYGSVRFAIAQQLVYHAVTVPTAMRNRITNVRCSAVGKQLMQKKFNFQAQLHLPTLDLFWANPRVRHHLPPLDLAWTRKSV